MNVKLYVNWELEEIVTPLGFQMHCDLKQQGLEADNDFLDEWLTCEKDLSVTELFRMSQEELDALKKEYSMYCSESVKEIQFENCGWQEMEIDI